MLSRRQCHEERTHQQHDRVQETERPYELRAAADERCSISMSLNEERDEEDPEDGHVAQNEDPDPGLGRGAGRSELLWLSKRWRIRRPQKTSDVVGHG